MQKTYNDYKQADKIAKIQSTMRKIYAWTGFVAIILAVPTIVAIIIYILTK